MSRKRDVRFFCRGLGALIVLAAFSASCATGRSQISASEKARLLIEAAAAAKSEGDSTAALQYLTEAEALDDSIPEMHHLRGIVLNMKREPEMAIASVKQALKLRPNYSDAMNSLGRLLMDRATTGKAAVEAEKLFKKAAADLLYRDSWKARTNLGILYYRRGDDSRALEQLTRAVDTAPLQACVAHYYIGHLRLKAGSFLEAARSYDHATQKFCAGFADAHFAEGVALERGREFDRARKKFIEISKSFPNTPVADQAMNRLKNLP